MESLKPYLKYILKMKIVAPLRSFFLAVAPAPVNRDGWEDRILLINLQALGDVTLFTSVLKHYKKRFPHKKIYLLTKGIGLEHIFEGTYVDHAITVAYSKFAVNPWYGARAINRLRRIGFHTVINQDFSAAEIMGKVFAVSLGAEEVIGYEGNGGEFMQPYDAQQVRNLHIVTEKFYPRFTKIVPALDELRGAAHEAPSVIHHYRTMYEAVTGAKEGDYSLEFPAHVFKGEEDTLKKFGLIPHRYGIVNVNASTPFKRWPLDRFLEVSKLVHAHGLRIVLVGSSGERPLVAQFEAMLRAAGLGDHLLDLAGKTNVQELIHIAAKSRVVITNDTSLVHLAVATKAPLIGVLGGSWFGMFNGFGHPDIHRWVFHERSCYGDNWACTRGIGQAPAPCLLAVETSEVLLELEDLLSYLEKSGSNIPGKPWVDGFLPELPSWGDATASKKTKVLYVGIRRENYDHNRYPSFEHVNFYDTFAHMPDVAVIEFPFDIIVGMGRAWWNRRLLETVQREKPDLMFAFTFSDEFDPAALDEIKKLTKSVAWFGDDHWRLWNYSRYLAPHFTRGVTTWSKAPAFYAKHGVTNIIHSQWAANPLRSKPIPMPRDIEVSFIGQRNSSRVAIIAGLRAAGIDVWARGFGWPEGRLSEHHIAETIARTKINLNFNTPRSRFNPRTLGRILVRRSINTLVLDLHLINNLRCWWYSAVPQAKARPFEIIASDAFLISARADDMEHYFEDKKEIVYYNGSQRDLVEKITYYREHPGEREKIAHAGYERALREHTYEKRLREIMAATL